MTSRGGSGDGDRANGERSQGAPRARARSIPTSADEIDAGWLEAALSERHPGARVEAVEITGRAEVTNNHTWLRVRYAAGRDGGAPETLFCKLLPVEPARRAAITATGMGLREARFYAELAPRLTIRSPRVHAARYDEADGRFVLLLEDLRASGCTVSSGPESATPAAAARLLEELAELHVRHADPARRRREAAFVAPPDPPSDYGSQRLQFALEHRRDGFGDAFAAASRLYIEHQAACHALWSAGPATVIHGDCHIGNLFFDGERAGLLDWGMVVLSTPLRDASYLIQMTLSVADRRAEERRLLSHYLEARRALGGEAIDLDSAWRTYRIQAAYLAPASCQVVTLPDDATPARRRFAAAFQARAEAAIEDLEAVRAVREAAGI